MLRFNGCERAHRINQFLWQNKENDNSKRSIYSSQSTYITTIF